MATERTGYLFKAALMLASAPVMRVELVNQSNVVIDYAWVTIKIDQVGAGPDHKLQIGMEVPIPVAGGTQIRRVRLVKPLFTATGFAANDEIILDEPYELDIDANSVVYVTDLSLTLGEDD